MQLSTQLLETTRLHPQETTLFLSIFNPTTAMSALVTGSVARGSRTIPFSNVSGGSYLSIESGMTLLVGTSNGGRELGKVRVKSATISSLEVAENSNIDWPSATHLTVQRYFENWPVYPRIISDPNNQENVIFYKDWDIAYTNQNSILGTFPCAGPHRAGWVGDSFYYSSSGTSHLLGSALTYDWAFEGGSNVTGSTSATPGYVRYDTPGHYVTRLVVTGANGSLDTTYRYVSIYNKPENSSQNNPPKKWNIDTVSGGRGESGYSTSIKITDETTEVHEGDVVVIFSDNWYGSQNVNLGGNSENNSSIFFVGHVVNNSINWNYKTSSMEFEVSSVTQFLKQMEGFSASVESKPSPSTWFELLDMDGRRALYHYLRWHSTVLNINDFQFFGTDQKIQYFDADRQSIFDAIDNYMRGTLLGQVCADLQGKIYAEVWAKAYSNPTGSFPTQMDITKRDWLGEPNLQENLIPEISHIETGGVAYSGAITGTFDALLSNAPGSTPGYRGNTEQISGLALASQSQLNIMTGNLLANRIAKNKQIGMQMGGNYRNMDIAPQMAVQMDILSTDTTSGSEIHSPYIVDSIRWNYNAKNKILLPDVDFEILVNGEVGETIIIPPVAEITSKGFNVPNFRIPKIPSIIPTPIIAPSYWEGTGDVTFVGSGARGDTVQNYSYRSGDTSLVSLGASGTYPTVTQAGIYVVNFEIYSGNGDIEWGFVKLQSAPTNNAAGEDSFDFASYYGGVNFAPAPYLDPKSKMRILYMIAGETLVTAIGATKNGAGSVVIRARLTLVRIG
jgi:hypothetical protein